MKRCVEVDIEVRYAETDQMGVVHHAGYLVWCEVARTRFCAAAAIPYAEIEALGYFLMITGVQLDYRRSARYGDTVRVVCRVDWVGSRSLQFGYEIRRGDELLASGSTRHLWVRRDAMRPCSMPEVLRAPFLELAGQEGFVAPARDAN